MEASATLKAEHNAVVYVLEQLEKASAAAAAGQPVPKDVFSDMEEFFRVFVTSCHHAKEETSVFPALAAAGEALPHQLEQEHEHGKELEQRYAAAVQDYSPGDSTRAEELRQTGAAYGSFLRQHIATENDQLLPAMERHLSSKDKPLLEAFDRVEVERIGAGVHERLHAMIDGLSGRIAPYTS